ncbi:hypothetical protein [Arcobacter sp.]|uniref:hypothetical protein n=1 Tax=Arcobacter sp. TaxID=1872629 RepID=UPI003D108AD0
MKTIFVLMIFIGAVFALKVNVNSDEKVLKSKDEVNLIFSSVYKSNQETLKKKNLSFFNVKSY